MKVHPPTQETGRLFEIREQIYIVSTQGQAGVEEGMEDKESLSNIRTQYMMAIKKNGAGSQGTGPHHVFQTFRYKITWSGLCLKDLSVFKH